MNSLNKMPCKEFLYPSVAKYLARLVPILCNKFSILGIGHPKLLEKAFKLL